MTELDLIDQEIKELEEQIARIDGSMNRQDNGVKLHRREILKRTLGRLYRYRTKLEQAA